MPYVTSVERIAKAEGTAAVLLKQLGKRWGLLPEEVQRRATMDKRPLGYPGELHHPPRKTRRKIPFPRRGGGGGRVEFRAVALGGR